MDGGFLFSAPRVAQSKGGNHMDDSDNDPDDGNCDNDSGSVRTA
jgi:hypothetical protein